MGSIRLRTKFLLSMVVVSAALTFTTLLVVRRTVQQEVRLGIQRDLQNSVSAFHNFQKQTEVTLERSAALLADLPIAALTRGITSSAINFIERLASAGSTQSIPA